MNRPLRAAVVGAAPYGFGARAHIPGALAAEGVELLAVCTSRDETAREAARRWGAPRWYGGIDRLLEDGEVDLVTVAVKPRSHHPLARAALEAGKMVYCEWPLALDSEEAADLASLAEARSLPTGVGLQGRWAPVLRCMRELVAEGFTGAPLSFDAVQKLPRFEVASDRSWLARETEASGALFVAAAHVVDAVRFVLSEPEAAAGVRATLLADDRFSDTGAPFRWEASDTVNCLLRLQGGEIGTLSVSNITDPPAGFMLRVAGDEGVLVARAPGYYQFTPLTLAGGRRGEPLERIDPPPRFGCGAGLDEGDAGANVGRALSAFAAAAADGVRFEPDFRQGLELHRVIDAVIESSDSGSWKAVQQPEPGGFPGSLGS